jgi:FlaA1/EpsC-like NDP-sugar epimerase
MEDVETVFHLANVANDPSVDLAPTLSWEVNVLATMRLVDFAIKSRVKNHPVTLSAKRHLSAFTNIFLK